MKGIAAFLSVLLLMPIGHTLMIITEAIAPDFKFQSAFLLGVIGLVLLYFGVRLHNKRVLSSVFGLVAGILIWTGWVEFSFVWIAQKLHVTPYMQDGEVATKPEYLVMLSSVGLLGIVLVLMLFSKTRCTFYNWFQKILKADLHQKNSGHRTSVKPVGLTTFIEVMTIIWLFYIVLLLVYDPALFGDKHWATYIVAYGSLGWSAILFAKLLKIQKFDYAVRYAIPTVVIFWNFIEILGRWGLFKEIWVHPSEHWIEMTAMSLIVALVLVMNIPRKELVSTKE